jgi:hypothetical protein
MTSRTATKRAQPRLRHLEHDLATLGLRIVQLAERTQRALASRRDELARGLVEDAQAVLRLERQFDVECVSALAGGRGDDALVRSVALALRRASDLRRMGALCGAIGHELLELHRESRVAHEPLLAELATVVLDCVRASAGRLPGIPAQVLRLRGAGRTTAVLGRERRRLAGALLRAGGTPARLDSGAVRLHVVATRLEQIAEFAQRLGRPGRGRRRRVSPPARAATGRGRGRRGGAGSCGAASTSARS